MHEASERDPGEPREQSAQHRGGDHSARNGRDDLHGRPFGRRLEAKQPAGGGAARLQDRAQIVDAQPGEAQSRQTQREQEYLAGQYLKAAGPLLPAEAEQTHEHAAGSWTGALGGLVRWLHGRKTVGRREAPSNANPLVNGSFISSLRNIYPTKTGRFIAH